MANFRAEIQGERGGASRLGHRGMNAKIQSYSGDIHVRMFKENGEDWVSIRVTPHFETNMPDFTLMYYGPVADLMDKTARDAMIRTFAEAALEERSTT